MFGWAAMRAVQAALRCLPPRRSCRKGASRPHPQWAGPGCRLCAGGLPLVCSACRGRCALAMAPSACSRCAPAACEAVAASRQLGLEGGQVWLDVGHILVPRLVDIGHNLPVWTGGCTGAVRVRCRAGEARVAVWCACCATTVQVCIHQGRSQHAPAAGPGMLAARCQSWWVSWRPHRVPQLVDVRLVHLKDRLVPHLRPAGACSQRLRQGCRRKRYGHPTGAGSAGRSAAVLLASHLALVTQAVLLLDLAQLAGQDLQGGQQCQRAVSDGSQG